MKSWIDLPFLIKNWHPLSLLRQSSSQTRNEISLGFGKRHSPLSSLALTRHPDRPEGTTSEGMSVYLVRKGATVQEDIPCVG